MPFKLSLVLLILIVTLFICLNGDPLTSLTADTLPFPVETAYCFCQYVVYDDKLYCLVNELSSRLYSYDYDVWSFEQFGGGSNRFCDFTQKKPKKQPFVYKFI